MANWSNSLEFWLSNRNTFGRCISCYTSFFSKRGFKKIFEILIILKKNKYFDNRKLRFVLNYRCRPLLQRH